MIDRDRLLEQNPIEVVIERDLGAPMKQAGRWLWWLCPFHDDGRNPSFGVTPDDGRFKCFGCGAVGNVIDYIILRDDLPANDIRGAATTLGVEPMDDSLPATRKAKTEPVYNPPPENWQDKALDLVYDCQHRLFKEEGEKALAYLHKRGFVDETIWEWVLGFQPQARRFEPLADWGIVPVDDGKRHTMWLPRGITMPCFADQGEVLRYVKVRRAVQDRHGAKYAKLAIPQGCSSAGLYGADKITGHRVLFLDEGEFNALAVWQEAGDLVDVLATGTASIRPETLRPFWGMLMAYTPILTRFDPDTAGGRSSSRWQAFSARVRMVETPSGKDPNEFHQNGGSVRDWLQFELARLD